MDLNLNDLKLIFDIVLGISLYKVIDAISNFLYERLKR